MKKVILIGGSGFLGSQVIRELLDCKCHIFVIQNRRPVHEEPGLTIIEGGIKGLTTNILNRIGPDAVFHCARPSMPRYRKWGRVLAAMQAQNLNRFLLSQIGRSDNPASLIFASGSLVYGNSNLPHSEDAPLNPISYSRQYHHGENPVLQAIHENKMRVLMLRFPWLLGNGSWFLWFYLRSLHEKKQVPLFGDGSNLMSLISLHDAARMMVRYGMSDLGSGIYNVFSPVLVTQKSFASMVAGNYAGTVTDYLNLYPKGVEKAVYEAFNSNILLDSNHPDILKEYPFQRLDEILRELLKDCSD